MSSGGRYHILEPRLGGLARPGTSGNMSELSATAVCPSDAASSMPAHRGTRVVDTCLTDCNVCGMNNRVFAVTDHDVMGRCFSCGGPWEVTRPRWSCQHPQTFTSTSKPSPAVRLRPPAAPVSQPASDFTPPGRPGRYSDHR